MMTSHFLFDYETLGQNSFTCPVIDCSYFVFEWERFTSDDPYTFKELIGSIRKDKMNVEDQVKRHGYKVEKSTIEWWSQQGEGARSMIKPLSTDITIEEHFNNVIDYVSKQRISFWWSRSNTFDPVIFARISDSIGKRKELDSALPYWGVRDTRTFIDAKSNFKKGFNSFIPIKDEGKWKSEFEQHNSIHDVAADILRLQTLTRLEHDLPIE